MAARPSKARLPAFRPPELATLVDRVPDGEDWLHEVKFDGYRCLLSVAGGKALAFTRSGLDWSDKFKTVVEAGAKLKIGSGLFDGEVVVLDAGGKSHFQSLQSSL